ncbi:uncharacterized protein LOC130053483 [Ostrea edulis]|uniref:uncharacterized protein LOC130053483 n=1 Tax=Ostrea edulis TaxID=37623 RepID=UPI0024AF26E2|nr:uncharacterized protein LOC130053483 [Ostrea edulis]
MFVEQFLCPEVQDSIEIIARCPRDEAEWFTAGKRKNCSKATKYCKDERVYHCVPNHYLNETVEVCAPWKLIVFGYCVEYNFLGRRVQENYNTNCTQFAVPCPLYYASNEVYKYQGCYELIKSTNSEHVSLSQIEQHSTVNNLNEDKEMIDLEERVDSRHNVPKSKKTDEDNPHILMFYIGAIFLTGIVIPINIHMFIIYRKRNLPRYTNIFYAQQKIGKQCSD